MLHRQVCVKMGNKFFVGSYTKAYLNLKHISMGDLIFRIPAGPKAGVISMCRDKDYNPKNPDVMLCFGFIPGTYEFQVVDKDTDICLASHEFELLTHWRSDIQGPSSTFAGVLKRYLPPLRTYNFSPDGPQLLTAPVVKNAGIHAPTHNPWRVAIILVNFNDGQFDPAAVSGVKTRWMNEIVNDVASTASWYREVSFNSFNVTAKISGPFNLANFFDDNFTYNSARYLYAQNASVLGPAVVAAVEKAKAGDPSNGIPPDPSRGPDWTDFDALLILSPTIGAKYSWPWTSSFTTTVSGHKPIVCMPADWSPTFHGTGPPRTPHETVSHELGHTLGLSDQYFDTTGFPSLASREVGTWEIMDSDSTWPHFSGAHLLWLGFLPPTCVIPLDFQTNVNQTATIIPIESSTPPSKSLIQVKLADNQYYYIEYRNPQTVQLGDQGLPSPNHVLLTDVHLYSDLTTRPVQILLAPIDSDGDGPVLGNGQDFHEAEPLSSSATNFRAAVSGINNTKADINIQYGIDRKPDPAIRTWPASPSRPWQSPDIEVKNIRNAANAGWFNVPWAGHDNTVVATVTNGGDLLAPDVTVEIFVVDCNLGGTPGEKKLGEETHDISAHASASFTALWQAPLSGHWCIIARIKPYSVPGTSPPVFESNFSNNEAQSNYDNFISVTGSPATRETFQVEVGNPFDLPLTVCIRAGQDNPLYRTYLETSELHLKPKEVRQVQIMHEFDPETLLKTTVPLVDEATGDRDHDFFDPPECGTGMSDQCRRKYKEIVDKYTRLPNNAFFAAFFSDPHTDVQKLGVPVGPRLLGTGMQVQIVTGKKTRFQFFYQDSSATSRAPTYALVGRITVDTGSGDSREAPVHGGHAILTFAQDATMNKIYRTMSVDVDGRFRFDFAKDRELITRIARSHTQWTVVAYYVPAEEYGDCTSESLYVALPTQTGPEGGPIS
ncbi:hypothetical protein GP486_004181 [Trichoglossum hirsutum]|uniref:M6 family metalloprotease domain-containing protein n=1 Tax=Trichoglossum hirsutum TaxID=265104 RepID=A0A9P8LBN6_9PEZI|nr:hypothetical protein GP486_004181 [Trichoglossum hirsutum]